MASDNNATFEERVQAAVSEETRKLSAQREQMIKEFEARERERAREHQALIDKTQAHMAALAVNVDEPATESSARRAMSDEEIDREMAKMAGEDAWSGIPRLRVRIPLADKRDPVQEVGVNGRYFLLRKGEDLDVPMPLYVALRGAGIA